MKARLGGQVAFVTGAARGQGRAHAVRLAAEGADILGLDLAARMPGVPYDSSTPEDLDETARLVAELDHRIVTHIGDTRDLEGMREFLEAGVSQLGRLDIVVANAGICIPELWDDITPTTFKDTMDINVTGTWNTVMAAAPYLIAGGGGSIILTSSYAGKKMQPFMVHYTTSKHAVTGMTRAFAAELGPHHIRVNSVHPGAVNTPMGSGKMTEEINRIYATNESLATMGTGFLPQWFVEAEDVAAAVAYLASDDARFVTSEHLSIDAGAQYF